MTNKAHQTKFPKNPNFQCPIPKYPSFPRWFWSWNFMELLLPLGTQGVKPWQGWSSITEEIPALPSPFPREVSPWDFSQHFPAAFPAPSAETQLVPRGNYIFYPHGNGFFIPMEKGFLSPWKLDFFPPWKWVFFPPWKLDFFPLGNGILGRWWKRQESCWDWDLG